MMIKKPLALYSLLIFVILFALISVSKAEVLSLEQFLTQVENKNLKVQASDSNSTGALQSSQEGYLPMALTAFATVSYLNDNKQNLNTSFQGTQTVNTTYSAGVGKNFSFGLNTKLTYNLQNTSLSGVSPAFFGTATPSYWVGFTQLDFSQSLWRNGFGKEVTLAADLTEAQNLATHYSERFAASSERIQSEINYYKLAISKESVLVQREILDRSKKILDWSRNRVTRQLADRADLLQSQAAYQSSLIDLQNALNQEKIVSTVFNTSRNVSSEEVNETLAPIEAKSLLLLEPPVRASERDDLKASHQSMKASDKSFELSIQKTKPNLDVTGYYALNGLDFNQSTVMSRQLSFSYPTFNIGLRFSAPLEFGLLSDVKAGRVKQQLGADLAFQRKVFDQDREWLDSNRKLKEAKERLSLTIDLEEVQKEKLKYEQNRLLLGRTTTYQVLLFEQDYARAQILRLRTEEEVLTLITSLKLFRENKEVVQN